MGMTATASSLLSPTRKGGVGGISAAEMWDGDDEDPTLRYKERTQSNTAHVTTYELYSTTTYLRDLVFSLPFKS